MNCYQIYKLIKSYYPEAIAYHDSNHVITKLCDKFYDKSGEVEQGKMLPLVGVEINMYERDLA